MLRSLYVSNYAIIDELEIRFSDRLTIITGETGAGKSILLGALSLILGKRADTSVLYDDSRKCIVEGAFDISEYDLSAFFEDEDLDYEALTLVRREINAKGKSRAFINDTPVTLTLLRKLTNQLVDLHAQHETLDLAQDRFQMDVLDAIAGNSYLLKEYREAFRTFRTDHQKLAQLKEQNAQATKDQDYYEFQLQELESAQLEDPEEQTQLENELETLNHAEEIKSSLSQATQILYSGEFTAIDLLNQIEQLLSGAAKYNPKVESLSRRLESSRLELEDINRELEHIEEDSVFDETRVQEVNDRLNEIYKLEKKHQVRSIAELISIESDLKEKSAAISTLDEKIRELESALEVREKDLLKQAEKLHKRRKAAIPGFEESVNELLEEVGMVHAGLKVDLTLQDDDSLNTSGRDRVRFLFSANAGSNYMEVKKVASGGELSRLMLIIKSLVAGTISLPTLIFDEIDAGISGEVGLKLGAILERLSKKHQVATITHLPQIASKGNQHYFVYKESSEKRTITRIKSLDHEARIVEIAKMLSGERPTDAALENARELLTN